MAELDTAGLLAIAAALGWASGVRLYAVVFLAGLAGRLGWVDLPAGLQVLEHPGLLGLSGVLLAVEFLADKVQGLDSIWDLLNGVLRIPAGATLAASVLGADSSTMGVVGLLLGGTLAASAQLAKTSTRAAINTLPEPLSNLAASFTEDGLVLGMLWLAFTKPLLGALVLVALVLGLGWLTWVCWRFLRGMLRHIRLIVGRLRS